MSGSDWRARSLAHVWHPCTQMHDHAGGDAAVQPLIPIRSAQGVWLEGHDGRRYLDAVSSWWTNIFGHRHPHIVEQLKAQLDVLEHVIFAGFTHEPAVRLAERLAEITPAGLTRCFYADNGSAAVEAALKMSHHYWRNNGRPGKTRFIALDNGYHGETLGALAVGGTGLYRDAYAPLMMQPIHVPSPDCCPLVEGGRAAGESWEDYSRRAFRHMAQPLERQLAAMHRLCKGHQPARLGGGQPGAAQQRILGVDEMAGHEARARQHGRGHARLNGVGGLGR